jgi:hypothetical protein
MKRIIAISIVALIAAPAFAQTTTVQEVTTRGMVMDAGGMKFDVAYKPDGSLAVTMDGADVGLTGTWRIDGEKLCTTSNFNPVEECAVYPAGKKSGDSFEVTGSQGTAMVTIK